MRGSSEKMLFLFSNIIIIIIYLYLLLYIFKIMLQQDLTNKFVWVVFPDKEDDLWIFLEGCI